MQRRLTPRTLCLIGLLVSGSVPATAFAQTAGLRQASGISKIVGRLLGVSRSGEVTLAQLAALPPGELAIRLGGADLLHDGDVMQAVFTWEAAVVGQQTDPYLSSIGNLGVEPEVLRAALDALRTQKTWTPKLSAEAAERLCGIGKAGGSLDELTKALAKAVRETAPNRSRADNYLLSRSSWLTFHRVLDPAQGYVFVEGMSRAGLPPGVATWNVHPLSPPWPRDRDLTVYVGDDAFWKFSESAQYEDRMVAVWYPATKERGEAIQLILVDKTGKTERGRYTIWSQQFVARPEAPRINVSTDVDLERVQRR